MAGGSWFGSLISGYLSDVFGRKSAIQVGAVIWYAFFVILALVSAFTDEACIRVISSVLVCASQNIGMLIVSRVVNGFSVGICSAQVPVYLSELAPPSKRGRLVGCQQWAITWGTTFLFFFFILSRFFFFFLICLSKSPACPFLSLFRTVLIQP
jgi:MFS family permease